MVLRLDGSQRLVHVGVHVEVGDDDGDEVMGRLRLRAGGPDLAGGPTLRDGFSQGAASGGLRRAEPLRLRMYERVVRGGPVRPYAPERLELCGEHGVRIRLCAHGRLQAPGQTRSLGGAQVEQAAQLGQPGVRLRHLGGELLAQLRRDQLGLAAISAGERQGSAYHRFDEGVGQAVLPIRHRDDRVIGAESLQVPGLMGAEVAGAAGGEEAAVAALQRVIGGGARAAQEGVAAEQPAGRRLALGMQGVERRQQVGRPLLGLQLAEEKDGLRRRMQGS